MKKKSKKLERFTLENLLISQKKKKKEKEILKCTVTIYRAQELLNTGKLSNAQRDEVVVIIEKEVAYLQKWDNW